MNSEKIGAFIKELRMENNLSQNDIAKELNIGRENISKWENGKAFPDASNLILLSDILHVTVDELLLGKRLTKDNKKEFENITLQLLDARNASYKKLKIVNALLLVTILVLATLSVIFIYLCFFNY